MSRLVVNQIEDIAGTNPVEVADIVSGTKLGEATGSGLVGYLPAGPGAVPATVQEELRRTVNVLNFYANGVSGARVDRTGVLESSAGIQAAINYLASLGGGTLIFPCGVYRTDFGITLTSNLTLQGYGGAVLKPSASVPLWAYRGLATNNVKIKDLAFEGTGTAYTDGNQLLLQISNAENIEVIGCTFTKARLTGLGIDACNRVHVSNCDFVRNYFYGADIRNSSQTTTDSCVFELNGDTGAATTAFGRGLVFWKTSNSTLSNCVFNQNTEYGLRLYSENADTSANRNIAITGCTFRDNGTAAAGKNDLYIYDDAKLTERVAISGCVFSTRDGNFSAVLSGREITLSGSVFKAISPQTAVGVSLFGSTNVAVTGNVFQGIGTVASFSLSAGNVSTNCILSNNQCIDVKSVATVLGSGHIIANNNVKKGGAGVSDTAFTLTTVGISATVSGNMIDGFYRGFNVGTSGGFVVIKDNVTRNSTNNGFFAQFQTDVSGIVCTGNSFDSAYPSPWGAMFSDSAFTFGRRFYVSNATPVSGGAGAGSGIIWKVGDRVFSANPAVGSPKSWVCTVAGAPGTWVSEGNL